MTVLCDTCSPRKQCTAEKNRTECKYYQPQTNEEWRKTCSAKEFAKWLEEICFREQYNDGESMSGWYEKHDEKYWEKWLKEKHNESV